MGRRMRPLNPADGVVERFACELRALRAAAGEPAFWKMARRCEASKSALAAAVSGHELPSDRVARAYVQACGGDADWWSERLAQVRARLEAERAKSAPDELPRRPVGVQLVPVRYVPPPPAMAMAHTAPERRRRGWIVRSVATAGAPRERMTRRLVIAVTAVVALTAAAVVTVELARGNPSVPVAVAPPVASVYDQTIGPGCPHTALAKINQDDYGETHKWTETAAANWNVARCSNLIAYSAPTASSNPDRWQDDYEWYFDNVPKTAACTFHIYIPDSPGASYTAAYDWTAGDTTYLDSTAFVIDQAAYRGQWFDQGPHVFATGQAMMMITDARSSAPSALLAAAPVRLTCAQS